MLLPRLVHGRTGRAESGRALWQGLGRFALPSTLAPWSVFDLFPTRYAASRSYHRVMGETIVNFAACLCTRLAAFFRSLTPYAVFWRERPWPFRPCWPFNASKLKTNFVCSKFASPLTLPHRGTLWKLPWLPEPSMRMGSKAACAYLHAAVKVRGRQCESKIKVNNCRRQARSVRFVH